MVVLNPNLPNLIATATILKPILEEIVFVGGTIVGLLVDDPGASSPRVTKDVDIITQIVGTRGYLAITKTMLELGFQPDTREGAPICRWVKDGLLVDLMGNDDSLFGASNPWYSEGFLAKQQAMLPGTDLNIYILSAPVLLLTKWVAYQSRGQGSMQSSHDIEDILIILDGRLGLREEAKAASAKVQAALADMAAQLFASQQFCDYCLESLDDRKQVVKGALEGFLP